MKQAKQPISRPVCALLHIFLLGEGEIGPSSIKKEPYELNHMTLLYQILLQTRYGSFVFTYYFFMGIYVFSYN